jgi:phospholipid/cholesterol/gamma-HCH transport system substrate-binding protein
MEKTHLEIKVGLFVFVGLVLLAVLLIQFSKGTSIFHGTYSLRLHATSVGGLKLRSSVLLSGVPVGSVSDIQLASDDKSVTIILKIYKRFKIYSDARFVIQQQGFLGDQYVAVIPTANQGPPLADGDEVTCEAPFNLQEVARSAAGFIQRIDETARKLDDAVDDVRRVVLNGQTLTNFANVVGNLRTVSEQALDTVNDVNALIVTNGSQINLAVSNMLFFSQQLTLLATNAGSILATNAPEINLAVKNVESSTEVLKQLMNDIQSGKGLAGVVLQNQELATNVQAIVNNLAVATSNLNQLGLWGFLWHKESPSEPTNPPSAILLSPRQTGAQP